MTNRRYIGKRFLGKCFGIELLERAEGDNHVMFRTLVEDDGNWFPLVREMSSFWLPEAASVTREAEEWCKANLKRDGKYGYRF